MFKVISKTSFHTTTFQARSKEYGGVLKVASRPIGVCYNTGGENNHVIRRAIYIKERSGVRER